MPFIHQSSLTNSALGLKVTVPVGLLEIACPARADSRAISGVLGVQHESMILRSTTAGRAYGRLYWHCRNVCTKTGNIDHFPWSRSRFFLMDNDSQHPLAGRTHSKGVNMRRLTSNAFSQASTILFWCFDFYMPNVGAEGCIGAANAEQCFPFACSRGAVYFCGIMFQAREPETLGAETESVSVNKIRKRSAY